MSVSINKAVRVRLQTVFEGGTHTRVFLVRQDGGEIEVTDFVSGVEYEHEAGKLPMVSLKVLLVKIDGEGLLDKLSLLKAGD